MNNEYWVKLTKRMNFQKYTKYTKYYNKLLNIVLSEKFEWFKKIELNDIQVGNIYESKNLIPIGKIYVDSIWGYNQWKEYHYDSSFPTDEEVSFGDIIGGDLSKEIQEQFKLCFSQIIGSLKPKYMCFSWLEMVLVDEDDNTLQESIRRILREETCFNKMGEERYKSCSMSDITRMEIIDNFLREVETNSKYNEEEPNYDMLLDDWDGYDDQVYIQNKLDKGKIIFYEGWVDSCWSAVYKKSQYKGMDEEEVIDNIITKRFPRIAEEFNMTIDDYGYFNNGDGHIMYIVFKRI
jgi:hypothetical protein